MPGKPDWGKRGVIAAWLIGASTLGVAVLTYMRPPDPAHPMSFDSWTKPISVPPWLAVSTILLVAVVTAAVVAWRIRKAGPIAVSERMRPQQTTALEMHPTSLDSRVTDPSRNIFHTAKLRLSFENKSSQTVHVLPLRWLTTGMNVSVQCGASPYPGVPYKVAMLEFGYRYQLEEYQGSWKLDKWRRKTNGEHDELKEINVEPGWTFRVWIGLNPCVPPDVLEGKRKTHQLGTLILPSVIAGENFEWVGEV